MTAAFTANDEGLLTLVPTAKAKQARPAADWLRPLASTIALAVPLVLINVLAVLGQQQWAAKYATGGDEVWAWLMAGALESVGVFLAYEAHRSLLAGDAAARLRAGSYLVGLLVGVLNYRNHAPDWAVTPAALAFGAMSTISPWLWAVRSRSLHRVQLRAAGLIDRRTVRFSLARWLLYPGATFRAMRAAVWVGETDPDAAVALLEPAPAPAPTATVTPAAEPAMELVGPAPQTVVPGSRAGGVRDDATTPPRTLRQPTSRPATGSVQAKVRAYRQAHPEATQKAIAEALGVHEKTVSRALRRTAAA